MCEKTNCLKSPSSLVHHCCVALMQSNGRRYLRLDRIIGIPEASIAQKLLEICIKKSVIVIKMKATFADGCYIEVIACGYHLAMREFLFGYYTGNRRQDIGSRITWYYSMKIQGMNK